MPAPPAAPPAARRAPIAEDLDFVRGRRVGRLATADAAGTPSVVPVCYALVEHGGEPAVVSALDDKPKRVGDAALRRVRDIAARPEVALVVDDYLEDWARLAFVALRGRAELVEPGDDGHAAAVEALRAKYPQYRAMAIDARPLIRVAGLTATAWRGDGRVPEFTDGDGPPRPTDLEGAIRGRRSVRAFRETPVPRNLVEAAIEAAGWAPSPHGRQPWRFAVVEAPARRRALAEAMAASWRAQLALDGQDEAVVALRLEKSRERLRTAPVLVVACLYLADLDPYPDAARRAAETTMAVQSLGAAVQNLLLSLYAAGLDGGWMCAPLFAPEVVRDALGLDAALEPHALVTVGYAAKDPVRRPRLPPERLIVSWE